ncbi:MAG: thiamine pyrophosphate-binding protein, partial [Nitrososphaerota archaeon]|nr:thiamine pyrophosphate-binding protein [Nitrososphaerota archaeon]
MKGREAVISSLINENVEHYFMVNAERIIGLNVSSELSGRLRSINATFEPGAGFMGLVYARVTGKVGVNMFVGGPGVLGAVSPITMAYIESDPLVVITVTPPRNIAYKNAHHALFYDSDQLNVFRSITKKQFKVTCVTQLPHIISRAFYEALSNRPGPVYIEIPADVLEEDLSEFNYVKLNLSKITPLDSEVNEVLKILKGAEKPVILAGRGVTIANAESELLTLAELLDIPICTTIMGKGIVSPKHPLYGGLAAGKLGDDVANELISKADVVLAIGVRFSELGVGRYSMRISGKLIHVLVSSEEIGRVFKPDLAIVADAKEFLNKLLKLIDEEKIIIKRGSKELLNSLWIKYAEEYQERSIETDLIDPSDIVKVLRE